MKNRDNDKVYKLVLTALMAALCYELSLIHI